DSEEKHEPVSDIDTVVVDSLKALDPEWPIREADPKALRDMWVTFRSAIGLWFKLLNWDFESQLSAMSAYFRLAAAVRSILPATTNVAPHQLDPKPPGLIAVKSPVKRAVLSLVKALQSPLFRSVS